MPATRTIGEISRQHCLAAAARLIGDACRMGAAPAAESPVYVLYAGATGRSSHPSTVLARLTAQGIAAADVLPVIDLIPDGDGSRDPRLPGFAAWMPLVHERGLVMTFRHRQRRAGASATFASRLLMAAASAGLFPRTRLQRHASERASVAFVTGCFERRDYLIRRASLDDVDALVDLERDCWAPALRASRRMLRERIVRYADGQLVLERGGQVVGALYSQRIRSIEALATATSDTVAALHADAGEVLQFLAVNVSPDLAGANLGDQLLELALERGALLNGIVTIAAVTRCKNFRGESAAALEAYLQRRTDRGTLVDPILRLHERHGARIVRLIPGYRRRDAENHGCGVLVTYDPHRRMPATIEASMAAEASSVPAQGDALAYVEQRVRALLGSERAAAYAHTRSFIEMGLTSTDLMTLLEQISGALPVPMDSTFLFDHPTPARVAAYVRADADRATAADRPRHAAPAPYPAHTDRQSAATSSDRDDIAIVGIACRLPGGVHTPGAFWDQLVEGVCTISRLPDGRWTWPADIDPVERHRGIDCAGFLTELDRFDPYFFDISPREAELIDPQQRILLELAWDTLTDANVPARSIAGSRTGVFIGASGSDYGHRVTAAPDALDPHAGVGTAVAMLANRLSYFFDLNGPSVQIDTACSSSLVAVHEAVKAIRLGECPRALVGGVNAMCHPAATVAAYKMGMLARDGKCRAFDEAASGYVRGEGAVMVLLEPLSRALANGNRIYGVIKGTATNHGGHASGLTVPTPEKQTALLVDAYRAAHVPPETVTYIEAHGTGTPLGDPIEVRGLKQAFAVLADGRPRPTAPWCGLGSVKTNIGHLEPAAGLAGLLKVLLSLGHRRLPRSLELQRLNPNIVLDGSPFFIVREDQPWRPAAEGLPLRAGVSSFGSGGVNAHVVLEEAPASHAIPVRHDGPYAFTVSARTEAQLHELAMRYRVLIEGADCPLDAYDMTELAHALQLGRDTLPQRLAIVARDALDLAVRLRAFLDSSAGQTFGLHRGGDDAGAALTRIAGAEVASAIDAAVDARDLETLASLWAAGHDVPWQRLYEGPPRRRLPLPLYPFTRERFWFEGGEAQAHATPAAPTPRAVDAQAARVPPPVPVAPPPALHPLLDADVSVNDERRFTKRLRPGDDVVRQHVVHGRHLLPGVAYLEMARAAATRTLGRDVEVLRDVVWGRPVIVEAEDMEIAIDLAFHPGCLRFEVTSVDVETGQRAIHMHGRIPLDEATCGRAAEWFDLDAIRRRSRLRRGRDEVYAFLTRIGHGYGPIFQCTGELVSGDGEALIEVRPVPLSVDDEGWLHPALTDAVLRTYSLMGENLTGAGTLRVPFSLDELRIFAPTLADARYAYARTSRTPLDDDLLAHISMLDAEGRELLRFHDFWGKPFKTRPLPVVAAAAAVPAPAPATALDPADLLPHVVAYLTELIAKMIKRPAASIQSRERLVTLGFTSVIIMELTLALRERFDAVPGSLFFEHDTVDALAQYFVREHASRLADVLGLTPRAAADRAPILAASIAAPAPAPLDRVDTGVRTDVAIVGIAGRYPKANTMRELWELLAAGRDVIEEVPPDRWDPAPHYSAEAQSGKTVSKWGGFLDDVDKFDAAFFSIAPREAAALDPQVRLFMEVAWEACEDAGYVWDRHATGDLPRRNEVGVFAGSMFYDYQFFETNANTSYFNHQLANRVSYWFNFRGPSVTVDTACSSSLTTVCLAVQSLRRGECYAALAGGANVSLHPSKYVRLSRYNLLATDGRCRAFGVGGTGYVPGEGVGAVLMKRLADALRDGDHIYGVIKGVGVNHGGKTSGFMVPNPYAQADVVARAIEDSGVSPRHISYVEAHGTGTQLGDPIEVTGLTKAFGRYTTETQYCAIGSVKSNVGHLEGSAGITSMAKVVLQLQHRMIAPSLHADPLNPLLDLPRSPFVVQHRLGPWTRPIVVEDGVAREHPRLAGISAFGAGGSNAHVIVQEYTPPDTADRDDAGEVGRAERESIAEVVPLSARSAAALAAYAAKLARFLADTTADERSPRLADIACTLQTGREPMDYRVAFVVRSKAELQRQLHAFASGSGDATWLHGRLRRGREAPRSADGTRSRRPEELARAWVNGDEVIWERASARRRIPLPTYAFERQRYWVELPDGGTTPRQSAVSDVSLAAPVLTYEEQWMLRPLEDVAVPDGPVAVLVIANDPHDAAALQSIVASHHPQNRVVAAVTGVAFRSHSGGRFEIDSRTDGYDRLFAALAEQAAATWIVIHRSAEGSGIDGIRTIFELIHAARRHAVTLSRLLLTGRGGDDLASCYDLSWIGFERSLRLIAPELAMRLVYHDGSGLTPDRVWRELWTRGVVRYAAGGRQQLGVAAIPPTAEAQTLPLRDEGVYLVTGGAGVLGAMFATHLARRCRARLVLIGRRPQDEQVEVSLRRIRAAGARAVDYVSADVGDRGAVDRALAQARSRHGRLHGVIHAAGLEPHGSMLDVDWPQFAAGLDAKIAGTLALDEALRDDDLDFVCYFSSVAGLLGDFGTCHYAIGNRFQLAHASYRERLRQRGSHRGRTIAIAWPLWRDGGMRVGQAAATAMYLQSSGQEALDEPAGLTAWEQALGSGRPHVIVVRGRQERVNGFLDRVYQVPPGTIGNGATRGERPADGASSTDATAPTPSRSGSPSSSTVDVLGHLRRDLTREVAAILQMDEQRLDTDVNFADLGFDSINLGELGKHLSRRFGFEVSPSTFFSHSTIDALADHLARDERADFVALYAPRQGPSSAIPTETTLAPASAPVPEHDPAHGPAPAAAAARVGTINADDDDGVAIIGMSGRFPGAATVDALWDLVVNGRSAVTEVPADRWDWRPYYVGRDDDRNRIATPHGAFVSDVGRFDARFFGIAPRDAAAMDPRQRLLLEEAWRAFEDAGYAASAVSGARCGVFIGAEEGEAYVACEGLSIGTRNAVLAARVSYHLNLHGPNLAINSACSAGLVALHLARHALARGECDLALVAGVNLLLSPAAHVMLTRMHLLSHDGACFPFDARATGMIPGEAVAVLLLKPLARARWDRDPIHGIVRGTAVNHDGHTNGLTAPSTATQADLLRSVCASAKVDADRVPYVLAHSTGSPLGDPIELDALSLVIGERTRARRSCVVGSIKAAIGHTFAASGLANLMVMCKAIEHGTLPPTLNCQQPVGAVDANGPLALNHTSQPWPETPDGAVRMGLVTARGMSGTNAAAIVQAADDVPPATDDATIRIASAAAAAHSRDEATIAVLSARRRDDLLMQAARLRTHLEAHPALRLADVAYTLQVGREPMRHRLLMAARDRDDLLQKLSAVAAGDLTSTGIFSGEAPRRAAEDRDDHGEDDEAAIARSLDGNPSALAARWCAGGRIDWTGLYPDVRPRRVPLPTYPFAGEDYPTAPSDWRGFNTESTAAPADRMRTRLNGSRKTVCVIGAGPSGLAMAKSLLEEGHEPVVYEKGATLGGLWAERDHRTGGAYAGVRFQTSRYTSTFSDFFADDLTSTFYSVAEIREYLGRYARQFDVAPRIQYQAEATSVDAVGPRWRVGVRTAGGRVEHREFDGVALCPGMFWHPKSPDVPGLAQFPGTVLHAARYEHSEIFRGKRVLVVGDGVSGMDIADEATACAARVVWSIRSRKLILPRMIGYVPNDCHSVAALLVPSRRSDQIERIRRAIPRYYAQYAKSGLLPTADDLERNPVIHINDRIVDLVAEGRIALRGEVTRIEGAQCHFTGRDRPEAFDAIVLCTGYHAYGFRLLRGMSARHDFAMGLFHHANPTLVNPLGLVPVAFTGSFWISELVSRWYVRLLSGSDALTDDERARRIGPGHRALIGPVAAVLIGLRLGLVPDPATEFDEFWRFINQPAIPAAFRLRGPHASERARRYADEARRAAFVHTDKQDRALLQVKHRLLAGLGQRALSDLLRAQRISADDHRAAADCRDPLALEWELQYVRDAADAPLAHAQPSVAAATNGDAARYARLVEAIRSDSLDRTSLLAQLAQDASEPSAIA